MSSNNNPFMDTFKLLSESMNKTMPMPNMGNVSDMQRKACESLKEVTQATTQTGQALWEMQVAGFQNNLSEMFKLMKEVTTSQNLESSVTKQSNFARSIFENNILNAREMAEVISKSSLEMFDMFSRNAVDNLDKSACMMPSAPAAPKKKPANA